MCGGKLTMKITLNTPSPPQNVTMAASCQEDAFLQQGQRCYSEFMGRWMEPNTDTGQPNQLMAAKGLTQRWRFTFQQNNNPKHAARTTMECSSVQTKIQLRICDETKKIN
ncbi:hypothetical protein XENORESO_009295, partial [Xenotaenia resolanae]